MPTECGEWYGPEARNFVDDHYRPIMARNLRTEAKRLGIHSVFILIRTPQVMNKSRDVGGRFHLGEGTARVLHLHV